MFQRILVLLDGSTRAEHALSIAAQLARASGGSVVLLRVIAPVPLASHQYMRGVSIGGLYGPAIEGLAAVDQDAFDRAREEVKRYLEVTATSSELQGITVETTVLFGAVVSNILAAAQSFHADLIVLCSRGYTGITRRIMGSVAEKLARAASVPVLVLREDGPIPAETHPDTTRPLRALVPLDGSAHAKAALEPAAYLIAALAGSATGVLHLVRVVQPVTTDIEEGGMLAASAKARRYLSATADHIREGFVAPAVAKLNLEVTWSVAVDTYVAETLIRTAENVEASEGTDEVFGDCDVIAL